MTPLSAILSAILDHLWQSTLLALAIALLVLALRKVPAAVRHGVWLTASIKFLVPFAGLAALGRLLAPRLLAILQPAPVPGFPAAVLPQAALIEKAAEPLARFPLVPSSLPRTALPLPAEAGSSVAQALHQPALHLDPVLILLAIWALGCAAVLGRWMVRSARVHRIVRASAPLAWPAPMPVVASPSQIGPGLVGLWRPVLVAPQTLSEHLTRSEIDAIIAHEACHLRRRDNLTAALHALVEAVFWFHPMVWWIGARMIAERELACDEAVLRAGHDRKAYARSLVETARLYVQSPLSCVAGASGVDLKTRVERIMTAPLTSPLSRTKKALLLAAGACAVTTPVTAGLLTPQVREAVAPLARAMAVVAAPAHALGVDQNGAAKPMALARNDAVLGPKIAVAATDAAPLALAQTLAPPAVDQAPLQASRPTEVAAAAPRAPAVQAIAPADPSASAASFVQSYAAATARRQTIARWINPICVQVVGLPNDQAAAVRRRIEAVAKEVGVKVQPDGCHRPGVEVGFTDDAQHLLDDSFKSAGSLLGDPSSGTQSEKTITLPIQAWYLTNGADVAANDVGDLKALANYRPNGWAGLKTLVQLPYPTTAPWAQTPGQPTASSNADSNGNPIGQGPYPSYPGLGPGGSGGPPSAPGGSTLANRSRQFLNAFIIVDTKRTAGAKLGAIADYVAMLALSQSRSLGSCQSLPSITDLFASCAGRAAPTGLTSADLAYLHALYAADHTIWASGRPALVADVAKAMAPLLSKVPPVAMAPPPDAGQAREPSDPLRRATSYVQSYAAAANPELGQIGRWHAPVCVQVEGLAQAAQARAIKARIEGVAQAVGLPAARAGCSANVEIVFSDDPQRIMDAVAARREDLMGYYHRRDRDRLKTVTHPMQAWYQTSTRGEQASDERDPVSPWSVRVDDPGNATPTGCGDAPHFTACLTSQFNNVFIVADGRALQGRDLGQTADYLVMLALSQPRSLDGCAALPSILDLTAKACVARERPRGLTPADAAYLTALYASDPQAKGDGERSDIANRMAGMLIKASSAGEVR